ncbi:MAG: FAD-dependent oxidoreductase [Desulfobacterales bacterium]|jgi:thioredoxin reductase (NADPH)|nr:FAD-dependent oxidoreductase [Desulfobacterales bacterium]
MAEIQLYDVVILGTGPAGIQAAIHSARKKAAVIVLGKESGSSAYKAHVENFAFIFKVSGEEMLKTGRIQANAFGAEFLEEDILRITPKELGYQVLTESGCEIETRTIIIATGTYRNQLGVPGEKELLGKGVSYCVDCDGNFFRGETVAVIGCESAAADGALTLSEIAGTVHLVCDQMNLSESLERKVRNSRIVLHETTGVTAIIGSDAVNALLLSDGVSLPVSGVFIELGAKGLMELALSLGIRLDDEMKYIGVNRKQETNLPGIYAAGDICGPPWQIAKAVGEGCVAGIEAASYAKKLRGQWKSNIL